MRKLASIQTVTTVEPIAGADAIERVRVLGWWVVVKKGECRPGDTVVYCEIDSLLPERPEFEFLRASSFKPARDDLPAGLREVDLSALHDVLDRLRSHDERLWTVTELKFFCGMTNQETAEAVGVAVKTIEADWTFVKSWLQKHLGDTV